jgi:hypothetical protein
MEATNTGKFEFMAQKRSFAVHHQSPLDTIEEKQY